MLGSIAIACGLLQAPVRAASPAPAAANAAVVPALVERAATAFATELEGVIGMQRHFTTVIKAGPIKHTETSESGVLFNNGAFVKMKYYSIADDGKAFAADKLASREKQANTDSATGKIYFREPYDRRFFADYQYSQPQACTGCAPGLMIVNFTSSVKDDQHGNGKMWIESGGARVMQLVYTPNALPQHATSGTVTETSSQVTPALWYVSRIDQMYRGHVAIMTGTGEFNGVLDHFQRFASLAQGEAALADGSI
ncbi:MAG: hypothetical protein GIW95_00635 [Candidatus Eremiobacteraeota bacterium]|nr:hypothetical protein [Candidatus Eremiobacteraeota bacterium]